MINLKKLKQIQPVSYMDKKGVHHVVKCDQFNFKEVVKALSEAKERIEAINNEESTPLVVKAILQVWINKYFEG